MHTLQEFPHPFSRIDPRVGKKSSKSQKAINWLSYFAVAELAWLGASGAIHVGDGGVQMLMQMMHLSLKCYLDSRNITGGP